MESGFIAVKRAFIITLAAGLLMAAGSLQAAEKMRVAVVDFQAKGVPVSLAQNVSELVRGEMINTGHYTIIERAQMGEILKEQGFQQAVCADDACAVRIGKILSANKIMVGSVMKLGGSIVITGRIVDVQSGAGEFSENQDAASETDLYRAVKLFTGKLSARIQGKAMEDMPVQPLPDKKLTDRLEGTYFARGINPNGTTYTGTVIITRLGASYKFVWKIGPATYNGIGTLKGKTLTVEWESPYPVIYSVEDDGRLVGTWYNGAATETLTPEK